MLPWDMNETLGAMARALFKDWFVDFGPTRAKREGREPYLATELWALFPERLDDEGKPEGWTIEPLLDQARLISGGTPRTDVVAYWNGPITWASAKDVSQCSEAFLIETERSITPRGLEESSTRLIPKDATAVVAGGATTGRYCLFGAEMAMNQTCYALASLKQQPFWLNCAFGFVVQELVHSAHGSVFDTITTKTIQQARVTISRQGLIDSFEETVSPLFGRIHPNLEESRTLTQTRDLLLPKLMSGEIRVREAEQQVAMVL
jgi:type I restriction enzyme S subunit